MKRSLDTLYCTNCGSSNVEGRAWVKVNENNTFSSYGIWEEEDQRCCDCKTYCNILSLSELWEELSEVPFDENEDGELILSEDFYFFDKGTSRLEIWHWFDERCPNNIVADLMGGV